ncbi:Transcriptional repressor ILP1-like protein [Drosera capensis]
MSSRSKNYRRRTTDADDDSPECTPSTTTTSNPKKSHRKLLSFADEDDSDSDTTPLSRPKPKPKPRPKPSRITRPPPAAASHKITPLKDRLVAAPASPPRSNVQPQAGQYTKEALLELQKNTRTLASASKPPPDSRINEPVIVLKGILKPGLGENEEGRERGEEEKERVRLGMGMIDIRKGIPDQATISKIKAEKERIRLSGSSGGALPDYISLEGGDHMGVKEGVSDEDDDEEPEFRDRMAMIGDKEKGGMFGNVNERAVVHGGGMSVEVVEGEEDEDEEDRKWEEEQVRKALGKRLDDGASVGVGGGRGGVGGSGVVQAVQQHGFSVGGGIGGAQGFEVLTIAQQAEIAKKALQDNVMKLKDTHEKTANAVTRTDEYLSIALTNIADLESRSSDAGKKYLFMQEKRDFVSVLCDFLQFKGPYIEELEEQMQKLRKEHALSISERRAADLNDEMLEVEAGVKAATAVFSRSGASASATSDASKAAQAAIAATRNQALPVELDEMGRDLNLKKRMDMTRRADARRRRKARSDGKRMSSSENGSYPRIEGETSTDESDDESAAYQSHRNLVLQIADQVFSDAAKDYSNLSSVKETFEEWKEKYSSSYHDAYLPLSVAAIFSPYVRLELLKWDPLHEMIDFVYMNWHEELANYGAPKDKSEWSSEDADFDLVPRLVEKVALPLLLHDVSHCWDVLSGRETRNLVSATRMVVAYSSTSNEAVIQLISAIRTRLAGAVRDLAVPTWGALVMKAVPGVARLGAYQFGVAIRLIRNICLWKDILAVHVLEKLALDEILTEKVLPHVRMLTSDVHDAITRLERVVHSLSGVWSGDDVAGPCSPKLQPLVDYALVLGKRLEKRHASGVTPSETSLLARRLKTLLVKINDYDAAREISKTFHLKEAL